MLRVYRTSVPFIVNRKLPAVKRDRTDQLVSIGAVSPPTPLLRGEWQGRAEISVVWRDEVIRVAEQAPHSLDVERNGRWTGDMGEPLVSDELWAVAVARAGQAQTGLKADVRLHSTAAMDAALANC